MSKEIESSRSLSLDFEKLSRTVPGKSLVVTVAQDVDTGAVLIVGFSNQEALEHTLKTGLATFYSTSRDQLWIKGDTSGDYLDVQEVRVNCEQNSLLYLVKLRKDGSCHTKDEKGNSRYGCYYRKIQDPRNEGHWSLEFTDPSKYGNTK